MEQKIETKWQENLVKDCKEIVESVRYCSGKDFLFGKWKLGDRILKDYTKFAREEYGNYTQEVFAKELGISQPQVSNIIAFRETVGKDFEAWCTENINGFIKPVGWKKIVQEWLRKPKEEKVKLTPEAILEQALSKFTKEKVKLLIDRVEAANKIYKNIADLIPLKELGVSISKLEALANLLTNYYNTKFGEK